ncbi:dual specificity phosphatase [Mycobacterium phage Rey]|uniref:PTPc tyrosine phosphatase n=1 Tax=Mycobacterium phage Rey TaxID=1034115 RepID=G1D5H5_9CAUD|nr:dual specificity phosphatase [Mycobacterium phage Rey]AEK10023.1 PTPc tyrosine phosphatase [Mycobacterium phage Rey]
MTDHTAIDIDFDPTVQRMTGVARHGNTYFDVPYVSQIEGDLWQGGCRDDLILPRNIMNVVSLYPWERYEIQHEVDTELYVRMYDSEDQGFDQIESLAEYVNERLDFGPVLIHCQAGLNRSSLLAAKVLHQRYGWSGDRILTHLRMKRSPAVLCNRAFQREVQSWPGMD